MPRESFGPHGTSWDFFTNHSLQRIRRDMRQGTGDVYRQRLYIATQFSFLVGHCPVPLSQPVSEKPVCVFHFFSDGFPLFEGRFSAYRGTGQCPKTYDLLIS